MSTHVHTHTHTHTPVRWDISLRLDDVIHGVLDDSLLEQLSDMLISAITRLISLAQYVGGDSGSICNSSDKSETYATIRNTTPHSHLAEGCRHVLAYVDIVDHRLMVDIGDVRKIRVIGLVVKHHTKTRVEEIFEDKCLQENDHITFTRRQHTSSGAALLSRRSVNSLV